MLDYDWNIYSLHPYIFAAFKIAILQSFMSGLSEIDDLQPLEDQGAYICPIVLYYPPLPHIRLNPFRVVIEVVFN